MKRKSLILISALVLTALVLGACAPAAGPASGKTKVRVATDATFPPFELVDEKTKDLTGFDVELMNAVAAKANFEVEWTNVGFDSLLAGISECQYDVAIAAITITEERKATMDFSDPYINAGQIVTVRKETTDVQSKDDLAGKKIGAQIGTTGAIEAGKIDSAEVKTYELLTTRPFLTWPTGRRLSQDRSRTGRSRCHPAWGRRPSDPRRATAERPVQAPCRSSPTLFSLQPGGLGVVPFCRSRLRGPREGRGLSQLTGRSGAKKRRKWRSKWSDPIGADDFATGHTQFRGAHQRDPRSDRDATQKTIHVGVSYEAQLFDYRRSGCGHCTRPVTRGSPEQQ